MTTLRAAGAGLVSAEQLARMPLDYPCELVGGRIVRMSPAGGWHGLVCGRVQDALSAHVNANALGRVLSGETGYLVRSDPDTVRAPDVAFVSHAALAAFRAAGRAFFPAAPDLAVEVLSPDDSFETIAGKVDDYLSAGSKAVWVASPEKRIVRVYEPAGTWRILDESATIDGGAAVPGFSAPVAAFFQDLPR